MQMKDTAAWQELEKDIHRRMERLKMDLLSCPLEEVDTKRAEYRALQSVLAKVEEMLSPIPE